MKRKPAVATALATGCALFAAATSFAATSDRAKCAFNGRFMLGLREYQCTLSQGNVRVHDADDGARSRVVGHRHPPG